MQRKGEAHETLLLLFQRYVVPPSMTVNNSWEQILGDFKQKCREAVCHLKQTEPYSPWMQAAKDAFENSSVSFPINDSLLLN